MATTPIQGGGVFLEISADNGTTWKKLQCMTKHSFEASRTINKTETQCGTVVGVGALQLNVSFEGVVNTTPDAGFISGKDLQDMLNSKTALQLRQQSPTTTGADLKSLTNAYLEKLSIDFPTDNVAAFNASFVGFGTWTIA